MKQTLKVLSALLVCLLLLSACGSTIQSTTQSSTDKSVNQSAESKFSKDWEPNPLEDFDYSYDEELQGVVLMYKGESEQVVYPSEFNGDPVLVVGVTRAPETIYDMGNIRISKVKEVYIPEGVQIIDDWAFRECAYLESIAMPDSLTTIGIEAFSGCIRLTKVHLPKNLEYLGSHAFVGCEQLIDITFDSLNALTYLGSNPFKGTYWQSRLPDGFITFGTNLLGYKGSVPPNLDIPEGISRIADSAFLYVGESIESIKFPESLMVIGEAAFAGCESLTTVNLPEGLTTIGYDAFDRCGNLDDSIKSQIRQINPEARF